MAVVRVLPDSLINQIAAGEVVERPASVVKELVENSLDAGADQIVIDIVDGGRTMISIIDNGSGMDRDDLLRSIERHATSKLPDDDLLNINFMGFRGEALPSIASVADLVIDTATIGAENGWRLDASTGDVRPSDWESGTRIRVANLFSKTPARLKFLRGDRAEMMSIVDVVKRLAMARPDVGFTLNNKWRFPKNQDMRERIAAVMGDDVNGRMLEIDAASGTSGDMRLHGFISEATLRRASSVDQYLFVNGRPVKDKVLVGALRAAYMDVMHAREFPLCALYLTISPRNVDVNVSPAKTEVHFLEPAHVRAFIIKNLRDALARTLVGVGTGDTLQNTVSENPVINDMIGRCRPLGTGFDISAHNGITYVSDAPTNGHKSFFSDTFNVTKMSQSGPVRTQTENVDSVAEFENLPLGRVVGQIGNKYIIAQSGENMVIVDQHAAHERITYEKMRRNAIKTQPLLTPIVIKMRPEDVMAIQAVAPQMRIGGLHVDAFGDDAVAIFEKPADWDLNWGDMLRAVADEVRVNGYSSQLGERVHLKLANYACHHSVRAGQKLNVEQMDALLREIEKTSRGGECNHGRPVYKIIPIAEMDGWFERI